MQAVLALYGQGHITGTVLDIGHGVTHVVPICEGFRPSFAIQRVNLAGRHLTDWLARLLLGESVDWPCDSSAFEQEHCSPYDRIKDHWPGLADTIISRLASCTVHTELVGD